MKRIIKKLSIFILALMIIVPSVSVGVFAASTASVTGGDQVSGGEIFTVTVTFNGDSIGRVIGDVTYDTEMLAYMSGGSSSGNVGYVELKKAGTGEPLVFELTFQALKEGSTQISVSASEMYDLNEDYLEIPSAVKTVVISGNADEEEIIEETNVPDDEASDEALNVDEKENTDDNESSVTTESLVTTGSSQADSSVAEDTDNNGFLAKAIMFGIGILILILIIAMILKRKK